MKKNILIAIGVLSVALIFFINAKRTSGSSASVNYEAGQYATDFKLKNIDGNIVSLAEMTEAKGFIIIFTCNTCPYSKMYEDRIMELSSKYTSKGFPVIAINPNDDERSPGDSFEQMKKRYKDREFNFPYLYDETQEVTAAYGATRTPHVFVLNRQTDKYLVAYAGAIDNNPQDGSKASKKYIENAVDNLLLGKEVEIKSAKSIGCSIKWKES